MGANMSNNPAERRQMIQRRSQRKAITDISSRMKRLQAGIKQFKGTSDEDEFYTEIKSKLDHIKLELQRKEATLDRRVKNLHQLTLNEVEQLYQGLDAKVEVNRLKNEEKMKEQEVKNKEKEEKLKEKEDKSKEKKEKSKEKEDKSKEKEEKSKDKKEKSKKKNVDEDPSSNEIGDVEIEENVDSSRVVSPEPLQQDEIPQSIGTSPISSPTENKRNTIDLKIFKRAVSPQPEITKADVHKTPDSKRKSILKYGIEVMPPSITHEIQRNNINRMNSVGCEPTHFFKNKNNNKSRTSSLNGIIDTADGKGNHQTGYWKSQEHLIDHANNDLIDPEMRLKEIKTNISYLETRVNEFVGKKGGKHYNRLQHHLLKYEDELDQLIASDDELEEDIWACRRYVENCLSYLNEKAVEAEDSDDEVFTNNYTNNIFGSQNNLLKVKTTAL